MQNKLFFFFLTYGGYTIFFFFFFSNKSIHTQTLTRLSWLCSKRIYCNMNLMQLPFTFLKFFLVRKSNYCHLAFVSPQRQRGGVQLSRKASCWIRPRYSEARTSQQRAGRRLGLQITLPRAGFGRSGCPPCHCGMSPPGGAGLSHTLWPRGMAGKRAEKWLGVKPVRRKLERDLAQGTVTSKTDSVMGWTL